MKPSKPNQPAQPKRHTIAYRPGWSGDIAYCTKCFKILDHNERNRRCEGKAK